MEDLKFYQVQFNLNGKLTKIAVVSTSMGEVTRFMLNTKKAERPKIRAMTDKEVKRWKGTTLYTTKRTR